MARKTLEEKIDDLRDRVKALEIEFRILKKIGYVILAGITSILIKLFWKYIITSPKIVGNAISALNITFI